MPPLPVWVFLACSAVNFASKFELAFLITNATEESPSWEASSSAATQEISRALKPEHSLTFFDVLLTVHLSIF